MVFKHVVVKFHQKIDFYHWGQLLLAIDIPPGFKTIIPDLTIFWRRQICMRPSGLPRSTCLLITSSWRLSLMMSEFSLHRSRSLPNQLWDGWEHQYYTSLLGELCIFLWEVFLITGLTIVGDIFDEFVPHNSIIIDKNQTHALRLLFEKWEE